MRKLDGIWPALVTPLTDDGHLHTKVIEQLVGDLLAAGASGLYICGGTGEGILLSSALRRQMAELVISIVGGRVPVMVHVGALNTETAVDLAQHANLAGADAISAIPPFYYTYSFPAIYSHYQAIARASQIPLYIYFIPDATGTRITPEQLLDICAIEGIAGLKYTSHDMYFLSRLLAKRDPDQVNVLSGPDQLFVACLTLGVEGAIGTTYNFMPRLYIDMIESFRHGEITTARRLQNHANDVIETLLTYGVLPGTNAILAMLGYKVGWGVPPMPPIEGDDYRALRADLENLGFFDLVSRPSLYGMPGDPMRGRLA